MKIENWREAYNLGGEKESIEEKIRIWENINDNSNVVFSFKSGNYSHADTVNVSELAFLKAFMIDKHKKALKEIESKMKEL